MRLKSRLMVLLALALMGCTLPGYAGGDDGSRPADGLRLLEPEMGPLRVVTQKSQPTRFVLTTSLDLPTPGYRFTIDVVEIDKEAGRIVARVTRHRPDGMVAQVITPTALELPLGSLPGGRYVFELHIRAGVDRPYRLEHAAALIAR